MKAKDYLLVKGTHEALVDEDTWYRCHAKRALNAFKREKTHSLDHVHILSGILKCPVCGAPMYGNVDRKKKKGGGYYDDIWYYVCKHRRLVDGKVCTFKRYVRQDVVNEEVETIVSKCMKDPAFINDLMEHLGADGNTAELEAQAAAQKNLESAEESSKRLAEKIADLPGDDTYEVMYGTLSDALKKKAQEIVDLRAKLDASREALAEAESKHVSAEEYRKVFGEISGNFDIMPMEYKREIMRLFVERIEIGTDPDKYGHWLKEVVFRFPVSIEGYVGREVGVEYEDPETGEEPAGDGEDFQPYQNTSETVVLMSGAKE